MSSCPLVDLCGDCKRMEKFDECWHYSNTPKIVDGKILIVLHDEVEYEFIDTPENHKALVNRNKFHSKCSNNHCVGCVVLDFLSFLK